MSDSLRTNAETAMHELRAEGNCLAQAGADSIEELIEELDRLQKQSLVAYQYWWPESPRVKRLAYASDLPKEGRDDLRVVPLYAKDEELLKANQTGSDDE